MTPGLRVAVRLSDGTLEYPGPMLRENTIEPEQPTLVVTAHLTDGSTEQFPRSAEDIAIRTMLADGARNLGASIVRIAHD